MLKGNKLGEGTFGVVYTAHCPTTQQRYAVKRNVVEKETSFFGAVRETDILCRFRRHPFCVRLERMIVGQPFTQPSSPLRGEGRKNQRDDQLHFVFPEAAGDMHHYIYQEVKAINGNTPPRPTSSFELSKKYMAQVLLAVEYIHSLGIIHRDLKPSNILIFPGEVAKLCDFGLAKHYTSQGKQTPNTVTSWYRAPEITLGYPHYDYRVDSWSLGCTFFELMTGHTWIPRVSDNNDTLLSAILGTMPVELPADQFRELVRNNKWRRVALTPLRNPTVRRTIVDRLPIKDYQLADLLDKLLCFRWEQRWTPTQCLEHPFFDNQRELINKTRLAHPPQPWPLHSLNVVPCAERRWMARLAAEIYTNRSSLYWYSHRAVFQAMDLLDRYITLSTAPQMRTNLNTEQGIIHDRYGIELRFMVCLHLTVKYFSTIQYPTSYANMVTAKFKTIEAIRTAEAFETLMIEHCQYLIYRPTIYEAADNFQQRLEDHDVLQLIQLYTKFSDYSGLSPLEAYWRLREKR